MRRSDRAQGRDFSLALIDRCTHGVMALSTGEAVPYCLPLSFVRVGEALYFQSVLVTGTASEVTDPGEKVQALRALCQKVTPDRMEGFEAAVEQSLNVTAVWKVHMEELSGKAKRER